VPVNCSALPENLLESELFGHRRGSFTGAIGDKKGLFEEADGGTIFLDEVGSMSAMLQSRLLRVLQEREVRRVGENTPIYVNLRVVAASNEPLEKRIQEGTFREDLYYRLNVIAIPLPSLRERRDDIPLLVTHFLKGKTSGSTNRPVQLTRQTMDLLCAYDWPGNVRELENAIERAVALCEDGIIRATDLPPRILTSVETPAVAQDQQAASPLPQVPESALYPLQPAPEPGSAPAPGQPGEEPLVPMKAFLRQQELSYLNRAIQRCGGNKEQAALLLGISVATMYRRLSSDDKES
jgi:transcriptional regulator with PAS, ATPase and Fis domain